MSQQTTTAERRADGAAVGIKAIGFMAILLMLSSCAQLPATTAPEPAQIPPLLALPHAPPTPIFEPLQLPPLQQQILGNGITVTVLPSARAPYIQLQLLVDAGRMVLGADADVLAETLRLIGSAETESDWQQQWRELGASLSVRSGAHRLIFSAEVLPHQADALFPMLLAMWQRPNLQAADSIARAKRNLRADQRQQDLLGGDYVRLWRQLAYGSAHPYGAGAADREALQKVSLASVQQAWQHAQRTHQQWLLAGSVADAPLPRWQQMLTQLPTVASQASWRKEPPPLAARSAQLRFHVLAADDAAQVNVMLGYALPLTAEKDRWTCEAFTGLLGNSSGRLHGDLRERRGLSYDPTSYCSVAPLASELVLTGSTRPEHAAAFTHGLLAHLDLLRHSAPTEPEMQLLRGALRGNSRMQLETARQRSQRYNLQEWLGGNWQTLQQQDRFWQQLPADALPAFANRWLRGEPVIVLRGDPALLARQVRRFFPTAVIVHHQQVD